MRLSTMAARRGRTARRSAPTGRKLRNVIPHTRFYLIRHAEVENPNRVLYGHLDGFPLRRLARDHAGETMALVSHADTLNAAWILLDGRPQNEREMHRSGVGKAGMLELEMEGETPTAWHYIPPPQVDKPASAAA